MCAVGGRECLRVPMNIKNNDAPLIQQPQHPLLTGSAEFRSSGGATADYDKHGESVIVACLEGFQMTGEYNVIFRGTRNARTDILASGTAASKRKKKRSRDTPHFTSLQIK